MPVLRRKPAVGVTATGPRRSPPPRRDRPAAHRRTRPPTGLPLPGGLRLPRGLRLRAGLKISEPIDTRISVQTRRQPGARDGVTVVKPLKTIAPRNLLARPPASRGPSEPAARNAVGVSIFHVEGPEQHNAARGGAPGLSPPVFASRAKPSSRNSRGVRNGRGSASEAAGLFDPPGKSRSRNHNERAARCDPAGRDQRQRRDTAAWRRRPVRHRRPGQSGDGNQRDRIPSQALISHEEVTAIDAPQGIAGARLRA